MIVGTLGTLKTTAPGESFMAWAGMTPPRVEALVQTVVSQALTAAGLIAAYEEMLELTAHTQNVGMRDFVAAVCALADEVRRRG